MPTIYNPFSKTNQTVSDEQYALLQPGAGDTVPFRNPLDDKIYQVTPEKYRALTIPGYEEQPQQPQIQDVVEPEPDGVEWTDYLKTAMRGGGSLVQGVGLLTRKLGGEDVGSLIENLGTDAVDYWTDSLSDAAKGELAKQFVVKNPETGEYEWGDAGLTTVGLLGAESLLATGAGMGAGAGITKMLGVFANPAGRAGLVAAAEAGKGAAAGSQLAVRAEQARRKLNVIDKTIGAIGFGAGEGIIGGMMGATNVQQMVLQKDHATMMETERYRQVYESTDPSDPEEARQAYAKQVIADEASTLAGLQSGLTTAVLGAPMGAFFGGLMGKAGMKGAVEATGRVSATAIGAAGEAGQEALQSGAEQILANRAVQQFADPDQQVFEDVLNSMVGGAAAGGVMGGAFGAAAGADQPSPASNKDMEKLGLQERAIVNAGAKAAAAGVPREQVDEIINQYRADKNAAFKTVQGLDAAAKETLAMAEQLDADGVPVPEGVLPDEEVSPAPGAGLSPEARESGAEPEILAAQPEDSEYTANVIAKAQAGEDIEGTPVRIPYPGRARPVLVEAMAQPIKVQNDELRHMLPDQPDQYFTDGEDVALGDINIIAEPKQGKLAFANSLMRAAYEGVGTRRGPVTLAKNPETGKYDILDGKSTINNAKAFGWKGVKADIVPWIPPTAGTSGLYDYGGLRTKAISSGKKTLASTNPASLDDAYATAEQNQSLLIDTMASIAKSMSDVSSSRNGIKKRETAAGKIQRKGYKDASNITDIVRASFFVNDAFQIEKVVQKMAERFEVHSEGYQITPVGYVDYVMNVRFPDGQVGEVQITPQIMKDASEAEGHQLYEQWRSSKDPGERRELSLEMDAVYATAIADMEEGWRDAVLESLPDPVRAAILAYERGRSGTSYRSAALANRASRSPISSSASGAEAQPAPSSLNPASPATANSSSSSQNIIESTAVSPPVSTSDSIPETAQASTPSGANAPRETPQVISANTVEDAEMADGPSRVEGDNGQIEMLFSRAAERAYASEPEAPPSSRKTAEIGRILNDERLAEGAPVTENTPANVTKLAKIMAEEVRAALEATPDAAEWYQQSVAEALNQASRIFPELATDPNARTTFIATLAILSNGEAVQANANAAVRAYRTYKETGAIPEIATGPSAPQVNDTIRMFNELSEDLGIDTLRQFFSTQFTAESLRAAGFEISGELGDETVFGSAILGPKIGQGFYQNLIGRWDTPTFDRWWMRTWGRMTGTLIQDAESRVEPQRKRLRAAIRANPAEARELGDWNILKLQADNDYLLEFATALHSEFKKKNPETGETYQPRTDMRYAAKALDMSFNSLRDSPGGGNERRFMRQAVAETQEILEADGIEVNQSAIQALLWYLEKRLYTNMGRKVTAKEQVQDYAEAFKQAADELAPGVEPVEASLPAAGRANFGREERGAFLRELVSERISQDDAFNQVKSGVTKKAVASGLGANSRDLSFKKIMSLKPTPRTALKAIGITPKRWVELETNKAAVEAYAGRTMVPDDMAGHRMFVNETGTAGFLIQPDGMAVSPWSDAVEEFVTLQALPLAQQEGGQWPSEPEADMLFSRAGKDGQYKYEVIDRRTGERMGLYKTGAGAIRAVDRLDNEYGGYRYMRKRLPESPLLSLPPNEDVNDITRGVRGVDLPQVSISDRDAAWNRPRWARDPNEVLSEPLTPEERREYMARLNLSVAGTAPAATGQAMPVGNVRSYLKPVIDKLAPVANIKVFDSPANYNKANGTNIPDDVEGMWQPGTRNVALFASNLPTAKRAEEVLVHETVGHMAMEDLPEFQDVLESVGRLEMMGDETVVGIANEVRSRYENPNQTVLAKEVIAIMAERGADHPLMSRAIAALREFLRRIGVSLDYTTADIQSLIARAARNLDQQAMVQGAMAQTPGARQGLNSESYQRIAEALDAIYNGERVMTDSALYSRNGPMTPQTETPEFKNWFGDSKVVDESGEPLRVVHGSTHDIEIMGEGANLNPENSFGKAFYFTDSTDDANINYAGVGPDLTARIEKLADKLTYDMEDLADDPMNAYAMAKEEARRILSGPSGGSVYPVYLKMENPFDEESTYLDVEYGLTDDQIAEIEDYLGAEDLAVYSERYGYEPDEESSNFNEWKENNPGDYREAVVEAGRENDFEEFISGSLPALIEGIAEAAYELDDLGMVDQNQLKASLNTFMFDEGEVSARRFTQWFRKNQYEMGLGDAMDEDGNMIASEILRRGIELAGYDGIIQMAGMDYSPDTNPMGMGMDGVYGETKHYIAFEPTQVKSAIGNVGSFDPNNPAMVFSRGGSPQTETPEFRQWFGDSKMVNKDGSPQVLYHGSKEDITEFKATKFADKLIFFATTPKEANRWPVSSSVTRAGSDGPEIAAKALRAARETLDWKRANEDDEYAQNVLWPADKKIREENIRPEDVDRSVYPVYLRVENPFDPRTMYKEMEPTLLGMGDGMDQIVAQGNHKVGNWIVYENPTVINELKRRGYDGIWLSENSIDPKHETMAVFDPSQIKSAVGNSGAFSRDTNDIRFSRAWHGSEASPFDKFSIDKVASGFGEAKFGWGLYFTESKGRAELFRQGDYEWTPLGTLYEVDIDDEQASGFLNWNAVAPDEILTMVEPVVGDIQGQGGQITGEDVYKALASSLGSQRQASEYLNEQGVSGIRYKERRFPGDGVEGDGQPDNFVLFDDKYIEVRGRYDGEMNLFSRRARGTDAQEAALEATLAKPYEDETISDTVRRLVDRVKDVDMRVVKQGLLDQAHSLKVLEEGRYGTLPGAEVSAYKMALLTKNLPNVMASVMQHGVPEYRDGSFVTVPGHKGFVEIFEPLTRHPDGNLVHLWEGWASAVRANRLINEMNPDGTRREKNMTQAQIDELLQLGMKYPVFQQVHNQWQAFNKQALDFAVERGVIDPESRAVWEQNDYVPFYRAMQEVEMGPEGPGTGGNRLDRQRASIKRLSGSEEKIGHVLENMIMNTAHLMDKAYKNTAMERIAELGEATDTMEEVPMDWEALSLPNRELARALNEAGVIVGTPENARRIVDEMTTEQKEGWTKVFRRVMPRGDDIVTLYREGKPVYYRVNDPLMLSTITGLGMENFSDLMKVFRAPKSLLTTMVTLDPAFMVANFMRDTLSSWVISDEKMIPIADAMRGVKQSLAGDPDAVAIMTAGAGGGGFYDTNPREIRNLLTKKMAESQTEGFLRTIVSPKKMINFYRTMGNATEQANRIAIYKRVRERGGSVAEAAYQAQDILNFTMHGDATAVRFLTQSVPFLNARLQGLYRLSRGAAAHPTGFAMKGMAVMAATLALALRNDDREEYDELPEWDKDTYWHVFLNEKGQPVGDNEHWRIPKPFEVGAMFATVPERTMRMLSGDDSTKVYAHSLKQMMTETFAFNPTPQLVKPLIEQYANRSMFTGSPIVGMAEQRLTPEAQYTPYTSATARVLANMAPDAAPEMFRSPRRVEHLLRAYMGTMGAYATQAADRIVGPAAGFPERPASNKYDAPVVKRFLRDPDPRYTKYNDLLYDMLNEVDAVNSTINRYRREGRIDDARELQTESMEQLQARPLLRSVATNVTKINNYIKQVMVNDAMTPEQKRERIDTLNSMKQNILRNVGQVEDRF